MPKPTVSTSVGAAIGESSDDRSRMTRPIEVVDNANKAALKLVHGEV